VIYSDDKLRGTQRFDLSREFGELRFIDEVFSEVDDSSDQRMAQNFAIFGGEFRAVDRGHDRAEGKFEGGATWHGGQSNR
jgi:hypothetical protein